MDLPQWSVMECISIRLEVINSLWPEEVVWHWISFTVLIHMHMSQWTGSSLVQVMTWHLFGAKSLPEPVLTYSVRLSWWRNDPSQRISSGWANIFDIIRLLAQLGGRMFPSPIKYVASQWKFTGHWNKLWIDLGLLKLWVVLICLNSSFPGKCNLKLVIFKLISRIEWSWAFPVKQDLTDSWSVNAGSGNGLVPSGNKLSAEPM